VTIQSFRQWWLRCWHGAHYSLLPAGACVWLRSGVRSFMLGADGCAVSKARSKFHVFQGEVAVRLTMLRCRKRQKLCAKKFDFGSRGKGVLMKSFLLEKIAPTDVFRCGGGRAPRSLTTGRRPWAAAAEAPPAAPTTPGPPATRPGRTAHEAVQNFYRVNRYPARDRGGIRAFTKSSRVVAIASRESVSA